MLTIDHADGDGTGRDGTAGAGVTGGGVTGGGVTGGAADRPAPAPGRSRTARRRRLLVAVALGAALVSVGGLGAATQVRSPAERAARAEPPPRSLLTAPVTSQVLNRSVSARAVIYPPARYDVVPTAASPEVTRLYVSGLYVRTGDAVTSGLLLAEVSGQPVFALRGAVPAYRDIRPGGTGPDVAQVQEALAALGHPSGDDPRGTFGPGTGEAVAAFYRGLGRPVPTTGAATQQAVDAARKAVETGRQTVESLTARKRDAGRAPTAAPTAPATATAPQPPATPPAGAPGPTGTGAAAPPPATSPPPATDPAATDPAAGGAAAVPAGADPERQLAAATRQLAADRAALARAEAANGPMVPAAHVVFLPALPATVTAVNGEVGSAAAGPLLSITSGDLSVTGRLTPAQAARVRPGMAVELLVEETGSTLRGVVGELGAPTAVPPAGRVVTLGGVGAAAAGGSGGAGPAEPGAPGGGAGPGTGGGPAAGGPVLVPVTVVPAAPLPAALNGRNVRLTVLRDDSDTPVTAVPVAAIATDAAGRTTVAVVGAAGGRTTVPVTTGVSADGMVAVVPAAGAVLRPGDLVVVGS